MPFRGPAPYHRRVPRLLRLEGRIQPYAWGSLTRIPALLGRPSGPAPAAELWLGTHPAAPSTARDRDIDRPLDALVGRLPWLLKVLAIERPLSLQVHPTSRQARAGAGSTAFPDRRAKPELVVALEPTRVLAGIRPARLTLAAVAALGSPALIAAFAPLAGVGGAGGPAGAGPAAVLRTLLTAPAGERAALLAETLAAARRVVAAGGGATVLARRAADLILRLQAAHPDDPAIPAALLLAEVELAPGEGLYLAPRMPHAYLSGFAIEVMASSDDVVRGGLTPKPVDVEAFLAVVDARLHRPVVRRARPVPGAPGVTRWPVPVPDFALLEACVDGTTVVPLAGPAIALVLEGEVVARADDGVPLTLRRGESVVAFDGAARLELSGAGRLVVARAGWPMGRPDRAD